MLTAIVVPEFFFDYIPLPQRVCRLEGFWKTNNEGQNEWLILT